MVDGILDLLTAILILGIVVSIAFGFIVPLTRNDVMYYDEQYEDKGAINETDVEGLKTGYEDVEKYGENLPDTRYYTLPELVLMLDIQDDRLELPNALCLRNISEKSSDAKLIDVTTNLNEYKGTSLTNDGSFLYVLKAISDNHYFLQGDGFWVYPKDEPNYGYITLGTGVYEAEKAQMAKYIASYMTESMINSTIARPNDYRYYSIKYHFFKYDTGISYKNNYGTNDGMWWVDKKSGTTDTYADFLKGVKG